MKTLATIWQENDREPVEVIYSGDVLYHDLVKDYLIGVFGGCGYLSDGRKVSAMIPEWRVYEKPEVHSIKLKLPNPELKIHVAPEKMNWHEAMDYAESIGMRLATKLELQAIAESTNAFDNLGWCWSSSALSNFTTLAWLVYLGSGDTYTNTNTKTNSRSVLCVSP